MSSDRVIVVKREGESREDALARAAREHRDSPDQQLWYVEVEGDEPVDSGKIVADYTAVAEAPSGVAPDGSAAVVEVVEAAPATDDGAGTARSGAVGKASGLRGVTKLPGEWRREEIVGLKPLSFVQIHQPRSLEGEVTSTFVVPEDGMLELGSLQVTGQQKVTVDEIVKRSRQDVLGDVELARFVNGLIVAANPVKLPEPNADRAETWNLREWSVLPQELPLGMSRLGRTMAAIRDEDIPYTGDEMPRLRGDPIVANASDANDSDDGSDDDDSDDGDGGADLPTCLSGFNPKPMFTTRQSTADRIAAHGRAWDHTWVGGEDVAAYNRDRFRVIAPQPYQRDRTLEDGVREIYRMPRMFEGDGLLDLGKFTHIQEVLAYSKSFGPSFGVSLYAGYPLPKSVSTKWRQVHAAFAATSAAPAAEGLTNLVQALLCMQDCALTTPPVLNPDAVMTLRACLLAVFSPMSMYTDGGANVANTIAAGFGATRDDQIAHMARNGQRTLLARLFRRRGKEVADLLVRLFDESERFTQYRLQDTGTNNFRREPLTFWKIPQAAENLLFLNGLDESVTGIDMGIATAMARPFQDLWSGHVAPLIASLIEGVNGKVPSEWFEQSFSESLGMSMLYAVGKARMHGAFPVLPMKRNAYKETAPRELVTMSWDFGLSLILFGINEVVVDGRVTNALRPMVPVSYQVYADSVGVGPLAVQYMITILVWVFVNFGFDEKERVLRKRSTLMALARTLHGHIFVNASSDAMDEIALSVYNEMLRIVSPYLGANMAPNARQAASMRLQNEMGKRYTLLDLSLWLGEDEKKSYYVFTDEIMYRLPMLMTPVPIRYGLANRMQQAELYLPRPIETDGERSRVLDVSVNQAIEWNAGDVSQLVGMAADPFHARPVATTAAVSLSRRTFWSVERAPEGLGRGGSRITGQDISIKMSNSRGYELTDGKEVLYYQPTDEIITGASVLASADVFPFLYATTNPDQRALFIVMPQNGDVDGDGEVNTGLYEYEGEQQDYQLVTLNMQEVRVKPVETYEPLPVDSWSLVSV
uniref:Uncharacterized protein n=1 Tax=viral metagenome TaxID=1070528 RepID=A0A2V0RLW4_9ZZZZ